MLEALRSFEQQNTFIAIQTYLNLRKSLAFEQQLISPNCLSIQDSISIHDREHMDISNNIRQLLNSLKQIDANNKQITHEYEKFAIQYHDFTKENNQFQQSRMNMPPQAFESQEMFMQQKNSQIKYEFDMLYQNFYRIEKDIENILIHSKTILDKVVLNYLLQWKLNQRLASNGGKFINLLPLLQEWFENLADLLWNTREQIKIASKTRLHLNSHLSEVHDGLPQHLQEATNLLSILITNSFVIEQQPKQVTKTHTRYELFEKCFLITYYNKKKYFQQIFSSCSSPDWWQVEYSNE